MERKTIDERLKAVFSAVQDEVAPDKAEEFAFHFRDCRQDLVRFVAVMENPNRFTDLELREAVDGMLLHAVGHLVQAARMYHGFIDPFGSPPVDD